MGKEKGGMFTAKAIGTRQKAKGLQKLKFYCQMCQKQCRDENGFKCHTTSESHQRQLLLFADNPGQFLAGYSNEFNAGFLDVMKRTFASKRVYANVVYQEYIKDREHIHMNATRWVSLGGYVKWLGREGLCRVEQTEKGWFLQYIDRDPDAILRQEELRKKKKLEKDDTERTLKYIEEQVERAKEQTAETSKEYTELKRETEEEKVVMAFTKKIDPEKNTKILPKSTALEALGAKRSRADLSDTASVFSESVSSMSGAAAKRKMSTLDEIMMTEEKFKEKRNRKDHWLHEGIVVKVVTSKLSEKYNKKKGVIVELKDEFTAIVKMLDSGDKLKLDQMHLETVIPAIGKPLLVVNGAYRGCRAVLDTISEKDYSCTITISAGPTAGRVITGMQYEDICKLDQ